MADLREARIPQHTIISRLGRGGMATVYLARHDQLGRLVAVKVIDDRFDEDQQFRQRFEREARTAAGLTHPNIVPVHEYGFAEDGRPFLSMAFIEGGSLRDRLRLRGPLPVDLALAITRQIASALLVAHARNIVHRDLKPDNVLFQNDTALLTDFGIAKVLDASTTLTGTGANPGTVKYFSPEQAKELVIDQRSDIYALGVVLYEMLTGYLPIHGDTAMQLILGIAHREPDPLPPPLRGLQPFLDILLAKDPADRLGSCADVIAIVQAMERNWLRHGEVDRLTDGVDLSTTGRRDVELSPDLQPTLLKGGPSGYGTGGLSSGGLSSGGLGTGGTGASGTGGHAPSLGGTDGRATGGTERSAPSVASMLADAHAGLTLSTSPQTGGAGRAAGMGGGAGAGPGAGLSTVDRAAPTDAHGVPAPQGLLGAAGGAQAGAPGASPAAAPVLVVAGRPVSGALAGGILVGALAVAVLGTYVVTRGDAPAPAVAPVATLPASAAVPAAAAASSAVVPAASPVAVAALPVAPARTSVEPLAARHDMPAARELPPRELASSSRADARADARREAERTAAQRRDARADAEAAAPVVASSPSSSARAASNLPAPPRELVVGSWEYSGVEDGEPMRIIWNATEDGRSRYLLNPGRPNVNAYEGTWDYANGVLTETLGNGRRVRASVGMVTKHMLEVRIIDGDRGRDVRRRFRRQ